MSILLNCTGVILAGGENRRMPQPKAFIKVNGKSIIERSIDIMKRLFNEIFIVTNQPEAYLHLGIPMLGDIYDVRGPMTGIFTSLINSKYPWVFVSACDMPFLNYELIRYMASKKNNYEAVVPKSPLPSFTKGGLREDYIEPLFAFYTKRLCRTMEKALTNGKTGLKDFLRNKKVRYVTSEEIRAIDPEGKSFINLNTPKDVELYSHPKALRRKR